MGVAIPSLNHIFVLLTPPPPGKFAPVTIPSTGAASPVFLHALQKPSSTAADTATTTNAACGAVMAKPDILVVDGHAFSWQRLCELRGQQLEAWKAAHPSQPALLELKDDCRPAPRAYGGGALSGANLVRS
jgi:hypothetical protein